jgi:hypothetical protein
MHGAIPARDTAEREIERDVRGILEDGSLGESGDHGDALIPPSWRATNRGDAPVTRCVSA